MLAAASAHHTRFVETRKSLNGSCESPAPLLDFAAEDRCLWHDGVTWLKHTCNHSHVSSRRFSDSSCSAPVSTPLGADLQTYVPLDCGAKCHQTADSAIVRYYKTGCKTAMGEQWFVMNRCIDSTIVTCEKGRAIMKSFVRGSNCTGQLTPGRVAFPTKECSSASLPGIDWRIVVACGYDEYEESEATLRGPRVGVLLVALTQLLLLVQRHRRG